MASRVVTQTISLPKAMARRARRLSRQENSTMSELFREAFRRYETNRTRSRGTTFIKSSGTMSWKELQKKLKEISQAGSRGRLSEFVIRDRLRH